MDGTAGLHHTYLAEYVDQSPVPRLDPGGLTTAWLRLRNIGTATWRRGGPNPTLLATSHPRDRASALAVPGVSRRPDRLGALSEATVAPGAVGRFEIAMRAPPAPGVYREDVQPVAEGLVWFNDLELFLRIDVGVPLAPGVHGLAADLLGPVPPLLLPPGGRATAVARLRNTGRVRWADRVGEYGPLVQLGTDEPPEHDGRLFVDGAWLGQNRAARVPRIVLPGETLDLLVPIAAPAGHGLHCERFRLVAEGVAWFGPPIDLHVMVV